ncbi:hypothetical protein G7047_12430 [Diaphorobacter sp. HDW4A]|uniref:hypothetical protein n=1 Tax=Diaphorobacter sp. HDW4A TaxID=2714924 RepID=UPI00140D2A8C|nr:hypothetical protein [Diaphorobacter sp. HDW4A]QIL80617.1 hypothetical protein G7047_12430 [Diaphorobacter sp. HDW4A]
MTRFKLASIAFSVAVLAGCAGGPNASSRCADPSSTDPACVKADGAQKGKADQAAQQQHNEAESIARFETLQKQLDEEVRDAEVSIEAAVEATKSLPKAQRARNTSVLTTRIPVTDSQSPRVSDMTVLDTVSIELPTTGKKKRGYVNSMNAVKALATRIADSRGGATILVEQASADVRGRKVNTSEGESKTKDGNALTVQKSVNADLPRGIERYTIKAGDLQKRP